MDSERAVTWATEADRLKDQRRRKRADMKHAAYMWWHGFYWKALHTIGLGWTYSKVMCRLNLYRKFPDGRCHWCGVCH